MAQLPERQMKTKAKFICKAEKAQFSNQLLQFFEYHLKTIVGLSKAKRQQQLFIKAQKVAAQINMPLIYKRQSSCRFRLKKKGKVQFTPSNYHKSPIFNLQLQNRITETIQVLEPDKFSTLGGFEGGFLFFKN